MLLLWKEYECAVMHDRIWWMARAELVGAISAPARGDEAYPSPPAFLFPKTAAT